ncbi:MAG: zf-HC2 domain-containing protein [Deltaproteobacteria bacterium]|nr:zf-HC2 domain-containing protein [Deltaproteobacteria bacterium]MDQ3301352.1 anti-sigma factor [Myxococcota bacterium]
MTCDDVRPRLTAYLDGELEGDRGTVVRGHLRTCAACRQVATDEATLRDGMRALPTVDPPAAMWASIQAQLAIAEVEESKRPSWRRALSRWTPMLPRFAVGGLAAAAAVTVLWWRSHREPVQISQVVDHPSPEIQASRDIPTATPSSPPFGAPSFDDVTADLAAEPARTTATYAETATELVTLAAEVRPGWTDEQRATFDARVAELRAAVDRATDERPRQRAWRAMIRYLQQAIVRDDVALASGGVH